MDPELIALLERLTSLLERWVALQPPPDTLLDKLLPTLGAAVAGAVAGLLGSRMGSNAARKAAETAASGAVKAAEATGLAQQATAEIAGAAQRVVEYDRAVREWRGRQLEGLLEHVNGRARLHNQLRDAAIEDRREDVQQLIQVFRAVEGPADSRYYAVDDPTVRSSVGRFNTADRAFTELFMRAWAGLESGDPQEFKETADRELNPAWMEVAAAVTDVNAAAERYILPPPAGIAPQAPGTQA